MVIDIGVVRNFWNARPCNIKHSDKTVGSAKYNGKRVLEIGCGIGTDACAIYTGIDLSQESVDVAL